MSLLNPSLTQRVIDARCGGAVQRSHGLRHVGEYTVASHSWGVAMLMLQIWPEDFPRLAAACLVHDVAEAWVGDIPAPVGKYVPGLKEGLERFERRLEQRLGLPEHTSLPEEDQRKVKICDCLEFYLWCREQIWLGNRFAHEPLVEVERYLDGMEMPPPAQALYDDLKRHKSDVMPQQAGVIMETAREMAL